MTNRNRKRKGNYDSSEDYKAIKSSRTKKHKKKAQRHFDKNALRGIITGTVDVEKYQQYVDDEH